MPKIQRLPPALANQIAAGEVVERPASVVKELVENSLDAGARRIVVTVERGGKALVRVDDDGEGMDREDAALALERHATSKIRAAVDLGAIRTLGFRGEALPSIASVSRLVLRTRARGAPIGTEIRADGGVIVSVRDVGMPEGTSVEVAGLFSNVPARRKFLKADAAEATQVTRVVTHLALAHPEVGFVLASAGRRIVECPPVPTLADRFFQLYGERPDLVAVGKDAAGVRVTGYVAALAAAGPVRGPQHVFVNRRIVKDRTIAHAIAEAYRVATVHERSPEVHLFIEVAADRVDVNVHPAKAEVRFLDPGLVHEVVWRAITEALSRAAAPALELRPTVASPPLAVTPPLAGLVPAMGPLDAPTRQSDPIREAASASGLPAPADEPARSEPPGSLSPPRWLGRMVPLGQFRDTFIIAVDEDGVAIIDQHVAHERVLFEQVLERLRTGRLESQRLLEPLVLDLAPTARTTLLAHAGTLARCGFEIEEFGGASVRVAAVPAVLGVGESAAAVRALAADLEGLDGPGRIDEALRRIAATTACHAAVKANCPLTLEKMRYLLDELDRTAYSTVCPHGRPVVLRLTRREIERNFQRL